MKCLLCGDGEPRPSVRALLYPGAERQLVLCPACGSSFYDPVPAPEEVARCYPHAYFTDFFRQYWKDYYKGRLLARDLGAWRPEGTVLDVGCALGTMLAGVRDHSRRRVRGLEYSPAAARAGAEFNKVEIVPGGLLEAPWPDASVDFVNINNVLEHERDPAGALAAAARLLSPGGRLRLVVPNGPVDLRATADLWRRHGRAFPTRHGGHLFFFSARALEALIARAGLRLVSIENFHFKSGAKARGWTRQPYRDFMSPPAPPPAGGGAELPLSELKKSIPPPPSWTSYLAKSAWKRIWRAPGLEFGYDFEVTAEKA